MPYRGARVLLNGGEVAISCDDIVFPAELAYGKNGEFIKFFILSYAKLLCDSPLVDAGFKPKKTIWLFLNQLITKPIAVTIRAYAGYADTILREEYSTGGDSSTRVFHDFMKDTPIFKEYLCWIRTGRPDVLKYVLSFLLFGKKLEYEDKEFDATAFRGWLEVEKRLEHLQFGKNDLSSLKTIVSVILPRLGVDHLLPKFGPGKVAERGVDNVYDKLRSLSRHWKLDFAFHRISPDRGNSEGFGLAKAITHSTVSGELAMLKFVPKDITKSRSICMEPNSFMYYQQEVLRWMRNSMDDGLISRFVDLDDQLGNQYAAVHGSQYLSSDTIDLSSASDSVHIDLVRGIFPPDYLKYMLATRTSRVTAPGTKEPIVVKKFAPMGSAVCFPTQCIIFTAVCLYAYMSVDSGKETGEWVCSSEQVESFIRTRLHKGRSASTPFTRMYEPPVVYGDDIITDSRVTDEVISALSRLGFSVNRSKSFTGSQSFRESCGVFAYEGTDVTPVLFRLPLFKRGNWDAKVYTSFIGGINKMREHGYSSVASFWLSVLKDYGFRYPLPFTTEPSGFGLYTRNKHAVSQRFLHYAARWQCMFEQQQGIGPRSVSDRAPEEELELYRYNQWWRSRVRGDTTLLSERSLRIRPQETRLAPIWARCE